MKPPGERILKAGGKKLENPDSIQLVNVWVKNHSEKVSEEGFHLPDQKEMPLGSMRRQKNRAVSSPFRQAPPWQSTPGVIPR
jgi:hypothetical protein